MQFSVQMTEPELREYLDSKNQQQKEREQEFAAKVRLNKLLNMLDQIKALPQGEWLYKNNLIEIMEFADKIKKVGYY